MRRGNQGKRLFRRRRRGVLRRCGACRSGGRGGWSCAGLAQCGDETASGHVGKAGGLLRKNSEGLVFRGECQGDLVGRQSHPFEGFIGGSGKAEDEEFLEDVGDGAAVHVSGGCALCDEGLFGLGVIGDGGENSQAADDGAFGFGVCSAAEGGAIADEAVPAIDGVTACGEVAEAGHLKVDVGAFHGERMVEVVKGGGHIDDRPEEVGSAGLANPVFEAGFHAGGNAHADEGFDEGIALTEMACECEAGLEFVACVDPAVVFDIDADGEGEEVGEPAEGIEGGKHGVDALAAQAGFPIDGGSACGGRGHLEGTGGSVDLFLSGFVVELGERGLEEVIDLMGGILCGGVAESFENVSS